MRNHRTHHLVWLLYLAPALIMYSLFMAYPLLDSLRLSFFTGNNPATRVYVGFGNFEKLFTDPQISH